MTASELRKALADPFPPDQIGWKPQAVKGNRALAIAYIDARNVMQRLDDVLGVENWQDRYILLPDNSVMCRLKIRIGEEWVAKADVGSPSEQPDGGDRLKAAFSDALKRVAVKFGIGRYLYELPHQWCDYDPVKKSFTQSPRLPDWAVPAKQTSKPASPAGKPARTPFDQTKAAIEDAATLAALKEVWLARCKLQFTAEEAADLQFVKDQRKVELEREDTKLLGALRS